MMALQPENMQFTPSPWTNHTALQRHRQNSIMAMPCKTTYLPTHVTAVLYLFLISTGLISMITAAKFLEQKQSSEKSIHVGYMHSVLGWTSFLHDITIQLQYITFLSLLTLT